MSLLPDHKIRDVIESGHVGYEPYDPRLVQPASIDMRLHPSIIFIHKGYDEPAWIDEDELLYLLPGQCMLASTLEEVRLPADMAARFEGKSSIGRQFLATHVTAGFIDPGFHGQITLELVNLSPRPIPLTAGMRIGQLCLIPMTAPVERPYGAPGLGSHYQGQHGPTPPRTGEPQ